MNSLTPVFSTNHPFDSRCVCAQRMNELCIRGNGTG